jgi:hypothetical protein
MYKEPKLVSLFPYQIKDVNRFYKRDHPVNINPKSESFRKYWYDFRQKCVEGQWIKDGQTWVYLMPKLFFYINYTKISSDLESNRKMQFPRLRDNEWIFFSYNMLVDGFSGFEDDEEFTCNEYIARIEYCNNPNAEEAKKAPLNEIELEKLPLSCFKKDGSHKKFIEPWHYLTRHYLHEHPADKPLGLPLYENTRKNAMILSARSTGKSYTTFVGDFLHEFLFNGIKRIKDISNVNEKLLFGMGAADGPYLGKTIKNITTYYDKQPGQYRFSDPKVPKYMGPFYKKVQGAWKSGNEINHIVKYKKGLISFIESSSVFMSIITAGKEKIGAGDRFRRIYIEEIGFLEQLLEVHSSNKDSMVSEGVKVGSCYMLGTGGDLKKIKQAIIIFNNPASYDIASIPHYWRDINKQIGLFIPVHYCNKDYKDKNGNTRLELCHKYYIDKRKKDLLEMDSVSYEQDISFNPMEPSEILRANTGGILPKQEAQQQLDNLDMYDIFKKRAQIGEFKYNPFAERGVEFKKDIEGRLKPILDVDQEGQVGFTKDGAWIIYEQPPSYIPPDLYWVLYDPAKKSGDGESYHSFLVYKSFYIGASRELYDTIVAEMICRKETLPDNYVEAIKAAKYFNAKIFTEVDVAGFVEWCKDKKFWNLLEGDCQEIEMEINPTGTRNYYKVGTSMSNKRKKDWAMRRLRDWLLEVKEVDPMSGMPVVRTIDWMFSKRALNEIKAFEDGEGNYDHLSSLLILMILIGKIHKGDAAVIDKENEESYEEKISRQQVEASRNQIIKKRSLIEQY